MSRVAGPVALFTDPEGSDVGPGVVALERAGFRVVVEELAGSEVAARARALGAVALLVTYVPITAAVLAAAPSVRVVSLCSVGYDCVDVAAATERGVWVANVPGAASDEVASHALAMALALVRRLPMLDRDVRAGGWRFDAAGVPRRLSELTLGVVGAGRIGRRLVELAGSLFGTVIAYDPYLGAGDLPAGVERVDLGECLDRSDVVSLHLPLDEASRGLIGRDALAAMRDGACLVNVSRGGLIDEQALIEALDSGRLAGAALDVTDPEPPAADSQLRSHPRLLVTPHAAFFSAQAARAYTVGQAENVVAWLRTGIPLTPVNQPQNAAPTEGDADADLR